VICHNLLMVLCILFSLQLNDASTIDLQKIKSLEFVKFW
jgi:hypothetical protein